MVYSTQNFSVLRLYPSSGIVKLQNTLFRKLDLFPSSGEWETSAVLGTFESAHLNHWCSLDFRVRNDGESPKSQLF
jgi:hypothetical protein